MQKVDTASFEEEVLKASIPVVADFYADWCAPCKRMEPILGKVAEGYQGKVKVVKINADENRTIAANYQVKGLPTLVLFRDGEPVSRHHGFQNEIDLTKIMEKASEG